MKPLQRFRRKDVLDYFPSIKVVYQKIAEPRNVRILLFFVYVFMTIAGVGIMLDIPDSFSYVLGLALIYLFGSFLAFGGIAAAFAVLPGIWWLERVGLILLCSGLGMYIVLVSSLNASIVIIFLSSAFILKLAKRFLEIKDADLAPDKES